MLWLVLVGSVTDIDFNDLKKASVPEATRPNKHKNDELTAVQRNGTPRI